MMEAPTFKQVEMAKSFLMDPGATQKQIAVAKSILKRNHQAAIEAGQADIDYLDDGFPEDDF